MKSLFVILLGLLATSSGFAGQFKTATYVLDGNCQFRCTSTGGVTQQVTQKFCKQMKTSSQVYVIRTDDSVLFSNTDPSRSGANQFRYSFGRHQGPSHMPALQMTDQYALTKNVFVNQFESSYADGSRSKKVIRFTSLGDGTLRKEEVSMTSGKFLGVASGKIKAQKSCRYTEH